MNNNKNGKERVKHKEFESEVVSVSDYVPYVAWKLFFLRHMDMC